jgi:glycosyltransferase involved in cell wall biosynthesis
MLEPLEYYKVKLREPFIKSMKTIQTVARYFPEVCGGIQIRLSELLPDLQAYGVESKIAAAQEQPQEDTYTYKGIEVYRYPAFPVPQPEPNHGEYPHAGFEYFARWLKRHKADIYHQHQWTPKCGLPHLRLAKELGMTTIVSIRLPEAICQRQQQILMLNGKEACDGKIDPVRCSQCNGVSSVVPPSILNSLSQTPIPVSSLARRGNRLLSKAPAPISGTAGALLRPLYLPTFAAARQKGLEEMVKYADRIVTLSQRLHDMLMLNGVPKEKLVICRTGVPDSYIETARQLKPKKQRTKSLRVVFLGRWNQNKGIHILVDAIKSLPAEVPIELTIHASAVDNEGYRQGILQKMENEPRIRVGQRLTREELPSVLSTYDVLALPAQWFDVRPMVVLEALTFGLPVLGSDLGGIPEQVRHNVDGLLIPPTDVKAWADALAKLALNPDLVDRLCQGIQPIRTMSMEAKDTVTLYQSLLQESVSAQDPAVGTPSLVSLGQEG